MKVKKLPISSSIETDPIWKEACDLCDYVYSILSELPEDEKWDTTRKLRGSANDLMFSVAQAVGNVSPSGTEFDWGNARKHAVALKTMYRFAGRQKFIELNPSIMIRLDKIIRDVSTASNEAYAISEGFMREDFKNWLKKLEIQKELEK